MLESKKHNSHTTFITNNKQTQQSRQPHISLHNCLLFVWFFFPCIHSKTKRNDANTLIQQTDTDATMFLFIYCFMLQFVYLLILLTIHHNNNISIRIGCIFWLHSPNSIIIAPIERYDSQLYYLVSNIEFNDSNQKIHVIWTNVFVIFNLYWCIKYDILHCHVGMLVCNVFSFTVEI